MSYTSAIFPKGTRFLITGVAGFIGSNLAEKLLDMGMFVRGIDNFSSGFRGNIEPFLTRENFEFIEGDIRKLSDCISACDTMNYVLHQAALGSVPQSIEMPTLYADNNIKGTENLLEASRQTNTIKRFVYASSSAVYGDSRGNPKKEGEEGRLLSPYALTKSVNEAYGALYTDSYGLPCIGLRYFNVFGKRQNPNSQYSAVIPSFLNLLLNGQTPTIYGDGNQTRDFTYIENVIEANLKACVSSKSTCGRTYNVAYGVSYSINQIYNTICSNFKLNKDPIYKDPRPGDIKHSCADISISKKLLGYSPAWNFEEGLKATISWYKVHSRGDIPVLLTT